MSDIKAIRVLESIPNVTKYSKINQSYDRIFKSRSLRDLLKSLKCPHKKYIITEQPETPKKEKEVNSNTEKILKELYNQKIREQKNKKKIVKTIVTEHRSKNIFHKKTSIEPSIDPFRYSPNYDSIKPRSPCYKIKLPTIPINNNNEILKNNKFSSAENISEKKNKNKIKLPELKSEGSESSIDSIKKTNGLYISSDKNNHALRFSKYAARGDFLEIRGGTLSYVEPHNYKSEKKNNAIDFKKMQYYDRNLINKQSLEVPSFCHYNPRYDLIEKKAAVVSFAKNMDKQQNKKYLLRKMWGNYEAKSEFSLIDNNLLK